MHSALMQLGDYRTYEGAIPRCRALQRRGLARWVPNSEPFKGYALTDEGRKMYEGNKAVLKKDRGDMPKIIEQEPQAEKGSRRYAKNN